MISKMEEHETTKLVQQMNKLMIRTRSPFIEQYETSDGQVKWRRQKHKLTDNVVRSHILRERTIGVFYANTATTFLVFDIDAKEDDFIQEMCVKGIFHRLKSFGIDEKDIHLMFSGMKGYHIQLFFDGPIKINSIAAFGRTVLAELKEFKNKVELRPESEKSRGVKLPLAFHKKSKRRAVYVDHTMFNPLPDSNQYFLDIKPMKREVMLSAIQKAITEERINRAERFTEKKLGEYQLETIDTRIGRGKQDFSEITMPTNKKSSLRKKAEKLLEEGLPGKGTRHQSQFLITMYYKDLKLSVDDAKDCLNEWIRIQWENDRTNERDLGFLIEEAERCVKYVYDRKDYIGLYDSRGRVPEMTYGDVIFAARYTNRNVRLVLWAILMIGRMYHEKGTFFAPMESIVQMTGLSRPTVSKVVKQLVDNDILLKVEEWSYTKQKARVYHMEHLVQVNDSEEKFVPVKSDDTILKTYKMTVYMINRLHYDIAANS